MARAVLAAALLAGALASGPTPGRAAPVERRVPPLVRQSEDLPIFVGGRELRLPLITSHALADTDATVRRVIVVIHGSARDAANYFDYAAEAVRGAPGIVVVAPWYANSSDRTAAKQLYWSDEGWKQGDRSLNRDGSVSSFEATDLLLARLRGVFPRLEEIVLAGHSAGGQFVQRYAATNTEPRNLFLVANASSYLYFQPERRVGEIFRVPDAHCRYDDYKYGLRRLNGFMSAIGVDALRQRYAHSRVCYLLGERDTDPRDPTLDGSCEANTQGTNRLQRGQAFYAHLALAFGREVYAEHRLAIVPGVGHSGHDMFTSRIARQVLLGESAPPLGTKAATTTPD